MPGTVRRASILGDEPVGKRMQEIRCRYYSTFAIAVSPVSRFGLPSPTANGAGRCSVVFRRSARKSAMLRRGHRGYSAQFRDLTNGFRKDFVLVHVRIYFGVLRR